MLLLTVLLFFRLRADTPYVLLAGGTGAVDTVARAAVGSGSDDAGVVPSIRSTSRSESELLELSLSLSLTPLLLVSLWLVVVTVVDTVVVGVTVAGAVVDIVVAGVTVAGAVVDTVVAGVTVAGGGASSVRSIHFIGL